MWVGTGKAIPNPPTAGLTRNREVRAIALYGLVHSCSVAFSMEPQNIPNNSLNLFMY